VTVNELWVSNGCGRRTLIPANDDLDATVQPPAFIRIVASDSIRFAETSGSDPIGTHAALHQKAFYRFGSLLETGIISLSGIS